MYQNLFSGSDACPEDINKTEVGQCGCGTADIDSNKDALIDCGSPRAFIKNIVPKIVSATPNGKGRLIVQVEGLSGSKLKYSLEVKGKKFKKSYKVLCRWVWVLWIAITAWPWCGGRTMRATQA